MERNRISKKLSFEEYADSQNAIREYIHSGAGHWGTHNAEVTVLRDGKTVFKNTVSVVSLIETNESFVEIVWPEKEEKEYYAKYSNNYQNFKYDDRVLEIRCQDREGNNITIQIESL